MLNRSAELTRALSPGLMIGQEIFHEFVEGMGGNVGAVHGPEVRERRDFL